MLNRLAAGGQRPSQSPQRPGYFTSRLIMTFTGLLWMVATASLAQDWRQTEFISFSARYNPALAVLNDNLYLVGGKRLAMTALMCDDVWQSQDGETWTRLLADGPFARRQGASLVPFAGKLFLIGGWDDSLFASDHGDDFRDIWVSADGYDWVEIDIGLDEAGLWTKAENGRLLALLADNQLVILDNAGEGLTVFRSTDGLNFQKQLVPDLADIDLAWFFQGRYFALSKSNIQLYSSVNGDDWYELPGYLPSLKSCPTEFQNRLYGIDETTGLVASSDGFNWEPAPDFADPAGLIWLYDQERSPVYRETSREGAALVVFKDRLWIIGGALGSWSSSPGISISTASIEETYWSSADGQHWTRHSRPNRSLVPIPRYAAASCVHKGLFYLLGGLVDPAKDRLLADCWAYQPAISDPTGSFSPASWLALYGEVSSLLEPADTAIWEPRAHAAAVSFHDRLWITGGLVDSDDNNPDSYRADVWSSPDGVVWRQETAAASFGARAGHSLIAHNDKLFLMGGEGPAPDRPTDIITRNDIWESSDGIVWRPLKLAEAPRLAAFQAAASAGGRLWLAGGLYRSRGNAYASNEVWSSTDAIMWRRELPLDNFSFGASGTALGNRFIIIGGRMNTELQAMVYSYEADGNRSAAVAPVFPAVNGGLGLSGDVMVYYPGRDDFDGAPTGSVWTIESAAFGAMADS